MNNVGIITQARTNSSRLPGKVLIEVLGQTLLEHHLDRLGWAEIPVVIATTTNTSDDSIVQLCDSRNVPVFRGSELDVLSRYASCARAYDLDTVVRVTSDCPLIDGNLIRMGVQEFLAARDPTLYLSNTIDRSYPRGMDFEVFSAAALLEADDRASTPAEREHVTPYIHRNVSGRVRRVDATWHEDKSSYRITLDTPEDLLAIRKLMEEHGANDLSCAQIIELLDAHPEIVQLNADVEQKSIGSDG